jgi:spore coat protein CotH
VPRLGASAIALALLTAAGCTGTVTGGADYGEPEDCPADNGAPDAPTISDPLAGRFDVIEADLTIRAGGYADPEGDPHAGSQWEIWQVAGKTPVQRVWTATTDAVSEVSIADGSFEVGDALDADQRYQVRVRARASEGCPSWGAWSEARDFVTDDGSTAFFAEDEIRDIYLDVSTEVLAALDAQAISPCEPFERETYPATMTFEGQTYDVGVKTKGGCGSSRDPVAPFQVGSGKSSWKVNLEWDDPDVAGCPAKQSIYGQTSLTLNNEVQDPSFVHEQLAYRFYRLMGVPAPRANNVRVHVNGELWGLYLNLETANRHMLRRHFESNDGMMYEGTYFCDLVASSVPGTDDFDGDPTDYCIGPEFDTDTDACAEADEGADPTNYAMARKLVADIAALPSGGFYPAITEIFDFDAFLSQWAADAIMNNWDGFVFDILNNYRIYHDPATDLWTGLPAGVDQTFTTNRDHSAFDPNLIVAKRCLQEQPCKEAYAARLAEALDIFRDAALPAYAEEIEARVAADVAADPRKEFGTGTFNGAVDATIDFIESRPAKIEGDLDAAGF